MDLNTLWFVLIAVLFTGFFVLEGFDYGVGILLPFLAKTDAERRRVINTIGPVWDGNEVWLLTAGGAIFAAFPHWYATLFSGFYLALFLMLAALIVRGRGLRVPQQGQAPGLARDLGLGDLRRQPAARAAAGASRSRTCCKGVPIDASKNYVGGFFDLLSPYTLVAGLASLGLFTTHGAIFLNLKSTDPIRARSTRRDQEDRPGRDRAAAALRGRHLRLDGRLRAARRQPGARAAAGARHAARGRLPDPPRAHGLGVRDDDARDRLLRRHAVHGALPARDGVEPRP